MSNPSTRSKTYWSILKAFCNNKKIPLIPPIFIGNKLESDFKLKANHFNKYFACNSTPINNDSSLPSSFEFYSQSRLFSLNIIEDNILKIDKNCINMGTFPNIWKKSNIVPVCKKGDKKIIDNRRPISLLAICGKILEKTLFNSVYEFLEEKDLLCEHQSGFRPSDSCKYQLLSIVHDIYASFDCHPPLDVRGIFLDTSKAFDEVWFDGPIYKIKCIGINVMFLKLIISFLENRFQRFVLNGEISSYKPVLAGVPQGSVLGPLFFLTYINDLLKNLSSNTKLFADDTSLFSGEKMLMFPQIN